MKWNAGCFSPGTRPPKSNPLASAKFSISAYVSDYPGAFETGYLRELGNDSIRPGNEEAVRWLQGSRRNVNASVPGTGSRLRNIGTSKDVFSRTGVLKY